MINEEKMLFIAQNLERHHYLNNDDATVKVIEQLAHSELPYAQYLLGNFYQDMRSDKHNELAYKWYLKAAEQGHTQAQFELAYFLERGKGASQLFQEQNDKRSQLITHWYQQAAHSGHKKALFRLSGEDKFDGRINSIPEPQALIYLKLSAFQYYKPAMLALAKKYRDGVLVKQSSREATDLLSGAQCDEAIQLLAEMYHHGKGIERNLNTAIQYYLAVKDTNKAHCLYMIHSIYEELNDVELAYKFLTLACNEGSHDAQRKLRGYDDSFLALKNKALSGNCQAEYELGKLYETGCELQSIKQNSTKAVDWYKKALAGGYSRARYEIGLRYLTGKDGIKQDTDKAIELFNECIARNKKYGFLGLALAYEKGLGVKQNQIVADEYYKKAKSNKFF